MRPNIYESKKHTNESVYNALPGYRRSSARPERARIPSAVFWIGFLAVLFLTILGVWIGLGETLWNFVHG